MSKGPCTFRKSDVQRAFEAAASAGVKVSVEIDKAGKLKLVPINEATEETGPEKDGGIVL